MKREIVEGGKEPAKTKLLDSFPREGDRKAAVLSISCRSAPESKPPLFMTNVLELVIFLIETLHSVTICRTTLPRSQSLETIKKSRSGTVENDNGTEFGSSEVFLA